ncbi:glycosyltransferase family 4 protein [Limnobacter sp.]|uniref:glycosyltransferase family 4 protein n=1 Tax=Limnobacter sp. TaxID=2003368 RepID=UPI0027327F5E|nr:glycosyltransferase family 4 protein [Limnobacter sp.]MDP3187517.1 glycosyltransferase family 4 protein [Limnobacter sp.]
MQLRDLSREFARQGHQVTVMLPCAEQSEAWRIEEMDGVQVLRLKAPATKDIGYVRRTICEFLMPFFMTANLLKSPLAHEKWHGVIWYAPSIFHGPFASFLKKKSRCKSYLIIRDIFPEWAVDMGLMKRGDLPHRVFRLIARYQYSVADTIGVQTPGNLKYFEAWAKNPNKKLEVLQNWLGEPANVPCSIRIDETHLSGRKIFVYAGNMGVAQGMDIILDLAEKMQPKNDVGFIFVGRGSEAERLQQRAKILGLNNTLFFDEIHPDEIPDLYAQCKFGIVALHLKHNSHNIPGKFITYMQSGLPVLANVNAGNDLAQLIRNEQVGEVCESNRVSELHALAEQLCKHQEKHLSENNCQQLFKQKFSAENAVQQIVAAL